MRITLFIICTYLLSCDDSASSNTSRESHVQIDTSIISRDSTSYQLEDSVKAIWDYDYNTDKPIKLRELNSEEDLLDLLGIFNATYADIPPKLEYLKTGHDTLFIKIENGYYLTHQMGSTGSYAYLQIATFTLTELDAIHYIYFDFIEGDHASPGTFERNSFNR